MESFGLHYPKFGKKKVEQIDAAAAALEAAVIAQVLAEIEETRDALNDLLTEYLGEERALDCSLYDELFRKAAVLLEKPRPQQPVRKIDRRVTTRLGESGILGVKSISR